jgi:formylglycine-generating enzyme required for sulfatase activity
MISVEPGTFMMGSPEGEQGRSSDEAQRAVTLSRPFELGKFPVTNLVWHLVMDKPLEGDPFLPKVDVSWLDAAGFCQKLNEEFGLPQTMTKRGKSWMIDLGSPGFRLPTEAEWEYCCRAGTTEARYGPLEDVAWHEGNSGRQLQPVGLKLPNAWGFYDTLGNAWEWCWDWYNEELLGGTDPAGPNTGSSRVLRGGSWLRVASNVRAARRNCGDPGFCYFNFGFRLARTLPVPNLVRTMK